MRDALQVKSFKSVDMIRGHSTCVRERVDVEGAVFFGKPHWSRHGLACFPVGFQVEVFLVYEWGQAIGAHVGVFSTIERVRSPYALPPKRLTLGMSRCRKRARSGRWKPSPACLRSAWARASTPLQSFRFPALIWGTPMPPRMCPPVLSRCRLGQQQAECSRQGLALHSPPPTLVQPTSRL